MDDHSLSLIDSLAQCLTVPAVAAAVQQAAARVGMTASAAGMVSGPRALSEQPFYFANWPDDWLALYQARSFLKIDAVPRWAMVSGLAVAWSELIPRLPASDPAHIVHRAAREQGFTEGFVTPVRGLSGALGLVAVAGPRDALSGSEKVFLQSLSVAALTRLEALSGAPPPSTKLLTLRERECVALLAQGFTDPEIGQVLGVSELTVHSHIANARGKLGARTRAQLVGLSMASIDLSK